MSGEGLAEWVLSAGVIVAVATTAVRFAVSAERRAQLRVLTRLRARRAERAAVEASVEDPAFSPEAIRASVTEILDAAQAVWASRETDEHRRRRDIRMIRGWAGARAGQIGAGLRISHHPRIDIVNVVNREDESEDRAVVRLHLRIHRDPKASANEPGDGTILAQRVVTIEDRWTLARHGDRWMLASVSGDPVSEGLISSPLIASPLEDEERVREAALRELAGQEAVPTSELAAVIGPGLSPPEQLRELAGVDDRFSPALLEAELHHLVHAWEARSDGSERPLEQLASKQAIRALMSPGGGASQRLIRDAELVDWKVVEVDLESRSPHLRVRVHIVAAVFGTVHGHAAGSDTQRTRHALVWTLTLDPAAAHDAVWQLTQSEDA